MKLVKMSLAAAVLLGASAYAIDNLKVSGDAKLFYGTDNQENIVNNENTGALFQKDSSMADTALRIGATGDLTKGVSFGVTGYAVSTLGLENNLVSNTWDSSHGVTGGNGSTFDPLNTRGAEVNDASWLGEAWIAATLGKTTAKLGRMELDTPLAFSEKWNITPNTFEGAVVLNQDIPDTTLVGAWVGKGNGVNALGNSYDALADSVLGAGTYNRGFMNASVIGNNVVGAQGAFHTFASNGAYAAAVINNSFKPLTAQAWFYNVAYVADAYWLQGDIDCSLVKGLKIGAQYANLSPKGGLGDDLALLDSAAPLHNFNNDTTGYAVKIGYEGVENLKVSAAFSDVDKDGALKIANVGTNNLGAAQSKLYTEAWWNYGYVGAPGATSYNVTAEYDIKDVVKLGAYFTEASVRRTGQLEADDMTEVALTGTKSFGPLDTTLAYISTKADGVNVTQGSAPGNGSRYDTVQAYLTLKF